MIALLPPMRANCKPESRGDRIAPRFVQIVEDVLAVFIAVRILNRHVDLRKDSEIVKLPLRIRHGVGRQGIARNSDRPAASSTSDGRVVSRPVVTTSRTNCCWPSSMSNCRSTCAGRGPGFEFHSNVALGKPFLPYSRMIVSRSAATLNSLNTCPGCELSEPVIFVRVEFLRALDVERATQGTAGLP